MLEGTSRTSCILDVLIITGKNDEEHLANLKEVLCRLPTHGLNANKTKCEFFNEKITFCGHDIDSHGLHKTPEKVEAVFQSAPPMQYSWGKVVPGASQLLQQILAQPVNSGTPFKSVVREQPSIEMDGTMWNNIPLLRAGINTFMTLVCH